MNTIKIIGIPSILLSFIPACVVIIVLFKWNNNYKYSIYAIIRMFIQLILIGYILNSVFSLTSPSIIFVVLVVMLLLASMIAMRNISQKYKHVLLLVIGSIAIAAGINVLIVTQFVLHIDPWFSPRQIIPLAGMFLSNAMNGISIAAERYENEILQQKSHKESRTIALHTALIPMMNNFLAVGIVSLPGMMTGQILSGVSPLLAVRYQVVIMIAIFSSIGIAVFLYLLCINKLSMKHIAKV